MADFNIPQLPGVAPPPQMTLGDMVNMARGAQAYQQSQQMNPLALQQQQLQISRLQQLTPEEVTTAQAGSRKAIAQANVAEQIQKPSIEQAFSQADTAATEALKAKYGLGANYQDDFTKILGGYANDPRLSPEALTKNKTNAVDVLHEIKAQAIARGIPSQSLDMITTPAMSIAMQNPSAFPNHLTNMINTGLTASEKRASQLETTEVTPSGQVIRKTAPGRYGEQQQVNIEKPGGNAPMQTTVKINGVDYFVGPPTTKNGLPVLALPKAGTSVVASDQTAPAAAPSTTIAPKTQPTTSQKEAIPSNKPAPIPPPTGIQRAPLFKEDNPIQTGAGVIPQMNEQQKTRYSNGQKIFSDAADANQRAADLGVVINNIKQTADQAQSSKPGQMLRQGGKWVAGNEQLDTLIKSLAQNQILQSQIMGGADSVNAQQTMAAATGSADIDPKALKKIAEQAEATKTATQMYNQGLTAYQKQDPQGYNSSIHANNFQNAWKDNYDPRIFMVENIHNSNMSADQKAKEIARIRGIATPAELKGLQQKAYNIRRLQMGDF